MDWAGGDMRVMRKDHHILSGMVGEERSAKMTEEPPSCDLERQERTIKEPSRENHQGEADSSLGSEGKLREI